MATDCIFRQKNSVKLSNTRVFFGLLGDMYTYSSGCSQIYTINLGQLKDMYTYSSGCSKICTHIPLAAQRYVHIFLWLPEDMHTYSSSCLKMCIHIHRAALRYVHISLGLMYSYSSGCSKICIYMYIPLAVRKYVYIFLWLLKDMYSSDCFGLINRK